jgi:N utilization substance protein B
MPTGARRRARVAALQALYEADSSHHQPLEALDRIAQQSRLPREALDFARCLIEGVRTQQDEIDGMIAQAAPTWPVDQLSPVDRNILRLAIGEMLGDNGTPVRVIINEAVELAKRFGSESSARFVNGVLGSIERARQARLLNQSTGRG